MPVFEAVNAAEGDIILLRFRDPRNQDRIWLIDGGPAASAKTGQRFYPFAQALLPYLAELRRDSGSATSLLDLVVCTHIDDDHINGIERLMRCRAEPGRCDRGEDKAIAEAPIEIDRVWFNSFSALLGPAVVAARPLDQAPKEAAIVVGVKQGDDLTRHLIALQRQGNPPIDGLATARTKSIKVNGIDVWILAPGEKELEELREEWMKKSRIISPAPQDLAPENRLDDSVANLSSIVMLVEFPSSGPRPRRVLLTGDARGDHVVRGYKATGKRVPLEIDVMKVPHHGAYANMDRSLLETFPADHYVFSANGKHDNPDPPVVEALVRICGAKRKITLHFTNEVAWSKAFTMEGGQSVRSLCQMKDAFDQDPTFKCNVAWAFRKPREHAITIAF